MVEVSPHPLLDLGAFRCRFPAPLGEMTTPEDVLALFRVDSEAPFSRSEESKTAVRKLLRHGGFKPAGRNKPASEYLVRAAEQGTLSSINLAVDVCNAVSLHSGLPISVVDCGLLEPPLSVMVAPAESEYVFNASGQSIRLDGLLCLADASGPTANAVKDSQRTKTSPATEEILCLVWGTSELPGYTAQVTGWYRQLLEQCGAKTEEA